MTVDLALQGAIVAALSSSAAVEAIVAQGADPRHTGIYDRIPSDAPFPYVSLGEVQVLEDGADCVDGAEIFLDLHAWSRAPGRPEALRLADAVRGALHEAPLELGAAYSLTDIQHTDTRAFLDPDGLTTHAVLSFHALVERL